MASLVRVEAAPRRRAAEPVALTDRHGYSNHGLARRLAPRRRVIQRVIDDTTELEIAMLMSQVASDDLTEISDAMDALTGAVQHYLAAGGDQAKEIQGLEQISACAAALDKVAIEMREDRADTSPASALGQIKAFAQKLGREARDTRAKFGAPPDTKGDRYRKQTEPQTLAALAGGTMKHLLITPRPGTKEAEGGGQQYPTTVTPEQEMVLALPPTSKDPSPFKGIKMTGPKPPVLEVLAVGGGHGGVKALFDQVGWANGAFSASYWTNEVVGPLAATGVKAKLIVLDACLTASMFDIFAPLLAPKGRIIGSMYSINGRLMTPEVWAEIFEAESKSGDVTAIVERSGRGLAASAPMAAAEEMANSLRGMDGADIMGIIKHEPAIGPIVSKLRYLPKISDNLAAYLRAKSDARRTECLDKLRTIENDIPPPDQAEADLVNMVIALLESGDQLGRETAHELVQTRLQEVTNSTVVDPAALERLARGQAATDLSQTKAAAVPAQTAVFDLESKTIRFDAEFRDPIARSHVELSTGTQSRREMAGIDRELNKMATSGLAQLTPVPKAQIFDH